MQSLTNSPLVGNIALCQTRECGKSRTKSLVCSHSSQRHQQELWYSAILPKVLGPSRPGQVSPWLEQSSRIRDCGGVSAALRYQRELYCSARAHLHPQAECQRGY